ncbi:MAG TPA: hypothetical protein DCL40_00040 [Coxiellaceae bacterium]|nr:hypothetical protein [Coxiellaceae bacterium]
MCNWRLMQWMCVMLSLGVSVVHALPRAQVMHLERVAVLPKALRETSGLILYRGLLWTQVDSYSRTLYGLDPKSGAIKKTIRMRGVRNRDWEAISQNSDYLFVGDIGNNAGKRGEITIYRINKADLSCLDHASSCRVNVKKIKFRYPDFQPSKEWYQHPYDAEAMVVDAKTITLFNKNWQDPSQVLSYTLPIDLGLQSLTPQAALPTAMLVTDASRYQDQLWLVGYRLSLIGLRPYVMRYTKKYEHWVPESIWKLDQLAQIEGMTVVNKDTVYFTCEQDDYHKAALFRAKLS